MTATCLANRAITVGDFLSITALWYTHSWACASMSFSMTERQSADRSWGLGASTLFASASWMKAYRPAASWKCFEAVMRPSGVVRSQANPCWLITAPKLNITHAFSRCTLYCVCFLEDLKASYQVKATWAWPFSLLMGKRVSMAVRQRQYLARLSRIPGCIPLVLALAIVLLSCCMVSKSSSASRASVSLYVRAIYLCIGVFKSTLSVFLQ
mmetsp:Transcript_28848/g.77699  ORF Transcript_28848/g.77699 Transcript_28848/m.77699 type:complete len:211 (+) Transcript_28848:2598-3230(+)